MKNILLMPGTLVTSLFVAVSTTYLGLSVKCSLLREGSLVFYDWRHLPAVLIYCVVRILWPSIHSLLIMCQHTYCHKHLLMQVRLPLASRCIVRNLNVILIMCRCTYAENNMLLPRNTIIVTLQTVRRIVLEILSKNII